MKRRWRIGLAIVAIVLLLGSYLLHNLERVAETIHQPPSAEVQRNPYLAAQRMLRALDIEVKEVRGQAGELPFGAGSVLIWPAPRGALGRRLPEAVARFVEEGGHLIAAAERVGDPLLAHFGIGRRQAEHDDEYCCDDWDPCEDEDEDEYDCDEDAESEFAVEEDDKGAVVAWGGMHRFGSGSVLGEPELQLLVRTDDGLQSETEPLGAIGPFGAPVLLQFQRGAGRITVLTSLGMFHNRELARFDHAEALYRLVQQPQPAQQVLFVRTLPGGLGNWLVEHAWRVLIVAGVLGLALLWWAMPRFGPVMPDPQPERRRLLDHLLASGRLLWSEGEQPALARAAVDAALARVRAEYPHTRWLPADALRGFLQRRFQLDPGLLALFERPDQVRHPAAFIALVRACSRIQNELSPQRAGRAGNPLYDR